MRRSSAASRPADGSAAAAASTSPKPASAARRSAASAGGVGGRPGAQLVALRTEDGFAALRLVREATDAGGQIAVLSPEGGQPLVELGQPRVRGVPLRGARLQLLTIGGEPGSRRLALDHERRARPAGSVEVGGQLAGRRERGLLVGQRRGELCLAVLTRPGPERRQLPLLLLGDREGGCREALGTVDGVPRALLVLRRDDRALVRGRARMLDGTADRAVGALGELGGEFGRHAVEAGRAQLDPAFAGIDPRLAGALGGRAGPDEGGLQPLGAAAGAERGRGGRPRRIQPGQPGRRVLRDLDAAFRAGQPGGPRIGVAGSLLAATGETLDDGVQLPVGPAQRRGAIDLGQQRAHLRGLVAQRPGQKGSGLPIRGDRRPRATGRREGRRGLLRRQGGTAGPLEHVAQRLGAATGVPLGAERGQLRLLSGEAFQVAARPLAARVSLVDGPRRGQLRVDRGGLPGGLVGGSGGRGESGAGRRTDGGHPRVHAGPRSRAHELRRQVLGDVDVGDLRDPRQQGAHRRAHRLQGGAGRGALGGQPLLGPGEPVDVEERAQQPATVLGLGAQEAGEIALRQQHHLAELLGGEPQPGAEVVRSLVDARTDRLPGARRPALDGELGLLGRRPAAALLGPLLLGPADHADPLAGQGDLARHLGADGVAGVVAAQPALLAPSAGHRAVEGVDDPVEQRRLTRAGRAPQQEEAVAAGVVEVDLDGVGERPERGEGQGVNPHRAASSRSAAVRARPSSASSAGPAWTPRTCWTNSPATSRSLRPRSRSW